MSRFTALIVSAFLLATAGSALAEPPPAAVGKAAPEPLWFEVPAATARPVARRAAPRPRPKLAARQSRYGNISLESLAARERGRPAVDCAASCVERQMKRKAKAPRREKRVPDLTQAAQLYR